MNLTATLNELIKEGKGLISYMSDRNEILWYVRQSNYLEWQVQAMSAIQLLGQSAVHLLAELERDAKRSVINPSSASRILGALRAALTIIEHQEVPALSIDKTVKGTRHAQDAIASRVFIVHGHDEALLLKTVRFLEKLGVDPVVLFEKAGKGQTIIEKLERNSDVQYAIVLLTPDDIGKAAKDEGQARSRARQNVVMELGYFLGKLGRSSVLALYDESVELPSDYRGVEYIKIDAGGAWKMNLARELKAAGIPVDMDKAL